MSDPKTVFTAVVPQTTHLLPCPECGHVGFVVDHLMEDVRTGARTTARFGPWYCDGCGAGIDGEVDSSGVRYTLTGGRCHPRAVLLKLEPIDPVWLVVRGSRFSDPRTPDGGDADQAAGDADYYEQHTCPTNYLREVAAVLNGPSHAAKEDPHGLFRFVASVDAGDGAPGAKLLSDSNVSADEVFTAFGMRPAAAKPRDWTYTITEVRDARAYLDRHYPEALGKDFKRQWKEAVDALPPPSGALPEPESTAMEPPAWARAMFVSTTALTGGYGVNGSGSGDPAPAKVAGPWHRCDDSGHFVEWWQRMRPDGFAAARVQLDSHGRWLWGLSSADGKATTCEAAQAAADAWLREQGWTLEGK